MSTGISFAPHPCAVIFAKETRQLGLAQDHAAGEGWSWDPTWVCALNHSRDGLCDRTP